MENFKSITLSLASFILVFAELFIAATSVKLQDITYINLLINQTIGSCVTKLFLLKKSQIQKLSITIIIGLVTILASLHNLNSKSLPLNKKL